MANNSGTTTPNRFQRIGVRSNAHAGRDFEEVAQMFLASQNLILQRHFTVPVGHAVKKSHRFDLGSVDPRVLVECKSYTWTSGGNSPSAKLHGLNEAMLLFSVSPPDFRKMLIMLRHLRGELSLATHYIRNHGHLVPHGVEIWELDPIKLRGECLLSVPPASSLLSSRQTDRMEPTP